MNEMLSRFVNEAISCLIIVPAMVLCLLPMKDKMKYSIKNVLPLFLGVLVMVTVIVSGNGIASRRPEGSLLYSSGAFVPCVQGHSRCGYCQMLCNVSVVVYYNELL